MNNSWNESEHPRDQIGRFTDKYGNNSTTDKILEGEAQKTDYYDNQNRDTSIKGRIGETLGTIFGSLLNPMTISTILNILSMKYTVKEMKKIKEELYEYMEKHSKVEQLSQALQDAKKQELLAQQQESNTENEINIKQTLNELLVQFTDSYIDKHFTNADKLKAMSKWVMPDAIENLDMAFDTPFARQHTVLRNADELSPILREHVKERIFDQLADDYGKNCVNTTKGIYFENDSKPSQRVAASIAVKNFIQSNKQYLKDFGYIKKSDTGFGLTEFNLWGAIGKAQIAEMYLEKSGEIIFYLIDTYDFNKNEDYFLIKSARLNQERGRLIPYFSVYSVKIDKETASKYLK